MSFPAAPLPPGVPPAPPHIPEALLLPVWNGAALLTSTDPQLALRRTADRLRRRDAQWDGYFEIRHQAEALESSQPGDVQRPGLERILDRVCQLRPEWTASRQVFLSVELECWMELTQPHPLAKRLYLSAVQAGQPVCFVEDTPFSPLFVQMVLQKCGYERIRHLRVTHQNLQAPGSAAEQPPPLVPELDGTVFLWTGKQGGAAEYVHQPLPLPSQPLAASPQLAPHCGPGADALWAGLAAIRTFRQPQGGPELWFAEETGYQILGPVVAHWALGIHQAAGEHGYSTVSLDAACPHVLIEALHRVHVLLGGAKPAEQGFPVSWDRRHCWPVPDRVGTGWGQPDKPSDAFQLMDLWLRSAGRGGSEGSRHLRRGIQAFLEDYLRAVRSAPKLPPAEVGLRCLERLIQTPHELEVAALVPLLEPLPRSLLDRLLGRGKPPVWPA